MTQHVCTARTKTTYHGEPFSSSRVSKVITLFWQKLRLWKEFNFKDISDKINPHQQKNNYSSQNLLPSLENNYLGKFLLKLEDLCLLFMPLLHRGRNQRYSFQIDLDYGSSTLEFLQFWNQNVVNILFLVVNSLKVTSGFNSKLMKKILDGATIEIFDI